jgi:hypothetical protein
MLTREFLLWSNCPNNCKFCWQRIFDDKATWLNEEQKVKSVSLCKDDILSHPEPCDMLIVGGEVFCDQGAKVNEELSKLFEAVADKVHKGEIRFLYANTSLIYDNKVNLVSLFEAFDGIEDSLKFTTSYDLSGRFNRKVESGLTEDDRFGLFYDNLKFIDTNYPRINTVVNTIVTKAVADAVLRPKAGEEPYNTHWFLDEYPNTVVDVNLIPYIPIKGDTSLDIRFSENVKVLEEAEKRYPGYLIDYVQRLDYNQDKLLLEYRSDKGYVERTAGAMPCGHNENFNLVSRADDCYICRLKQYVSDNRDRLTEPR